MNQIPKSCKEEFYNFKDLCDAALQGDRRRAVRILQDQSQCLFQQENPDPEELSTFLTSMNRSMYNYILFTTDLSLYHCCFENIHNLRDCKTQQEFFTMAYSIMDSYLEQLERTPRNNRYIIKAQDYIARNLDKHLTLEEVSSHVYISRTYLSELFPEYTGKSFTAYVGDCRMKLAAQLLVSSGLSIQDVGHSCGFDSPAYFSTSFTKQYGVSPRRYRMEKWNRQPLLA